MKTREATAAAVADVLRYSRERAGISQEDLAKEIDTSQSQVSKVERGESFPRFENLMAWSKAVKVPAWKILREVERQMKLRSQQANNITASSN